MIRIFMLAGLMSLCAGSALANDVAVLLGNRDYVRAGTVAGADAVFDLQFPLRQAGFDVISGRDVSGDELEFVLDSVLEQLDDADRLIFVMAGHVVSQGSNSIYLPAEANPTNGLRMSRNALSIPEIMQIAATRPGGAIVAIGTERGSVRRLDDRWREGIGGTEIPQGVTLVSGTPEAVTEFVDLVVLDEATPMLDGVRGFDSEVAVEGFVSHQSPFLGESSERNHDWDALIEEGYWAAVQDLGTSEAVQSYLRRYPRGIFKAEAGSLLSVIRERPQLEAEAAEAALRLDRNTRRAIQRALVLLDYDTRGIDGIFGRGTRGGIRSWQEDNNHFVSGYLNRPQLVMLNAQAEDRRAELEAEAEARARLEAAREGTVWRRAERTDTPEAYRSYLERYPDGTYVEDAQERLRQFERQARREARAEERLFWDEVRQNGSAESYRLYLQRYPNGSFVGEAQASLAELEAHVDTDRLTAIENQVLGNPVIRLLAERRLAELGLDPGRVDGQFDENTRRAVRRFQRARDIEVTGYVDQATAVRMLAEAIGR